MMHKNVIVKPGRCLRGDEAALFAAEIYRMYVHYAEKQRWKVELINVDDRYRWHEGSAVHHQWAGRILQDEV